ncbi:hypothetical protein O3P69_017654 [Scylla paramamosain]|uniref:Uncharacterized protein n=1 Tax=Scylla paramamosain TaxID=85552 RepID=A0AAW0TY46_SCYPA
MHADGRGVWAAEVGVSVAGVSILFSPNVTAFRKCVWGVVLGACLLVLIGFVAERVAFFFTYPVNMDVEIIYNDSLVSPAITICPSPRGLDVDLNPLAVKEEYLNFTQETSYPGMKKAMKFLKKKLNAKELWDRVAWNVSAMIDIAATSALQVSGYMCKGAPATLPGSYNGLYLRLEQETTSEEGDELDEEEEQEERMGTDDEKTTKGWWVVIHEAEDDPSLLIKTHGYLVGVNWDKDISVSLKLYETTNTRKRRCEDDPSYRLTRCHNECFSGAFAREKGCRLPFMRVDAPYCRGVETEAILTKMLRGGTWQQTQCNCLPPCNHALYHYRGDTADNRGDDKGRIKMFFLDLMYEQVTESLTYPLASLVADFGGMTGLLLGASVLTLLELLECLVVGLARLYRRRRNKTSRSRPQPEHLSFQYNLKCDFNFPPSSECVSSTPKY